MKTVIYLQTELEGDALQGFYRCRHAHYKEIKELARSHDGSSPTKLIQITSEIHDEATLKEKFNRFGTFIDKISAHILAKELHPDGIIADDLSMEINTDINILTLDEAKILKIAELDVNQATLICQGFVYDSKKFGSSDRDQANWSTLMNTILLNYKLGATDEQIFPIAEEVKDWDGAWVPITDLAHLNSIISAGKAHVNSYRTSYKTLKEAVLSATSVQEVADVVDNRA